MEVKKNILGHLRDVKIIIIRAFIIFCLSFGVAIYFSDYIFEALLKIFDFTNIKLIFTNIEGAFLSKVLISFDVAIVLLLPYFVLELVLYIKDCFRKKISFMPIYLVAVLLYFLSVFFTVKIIIPIIVKFFLSIGFFGVDFYVDANIFLSFLMKIILCFGIVFEFPVILLLLNTLGVIKREHLIKARKFVFVGSFIVGAILTPPDVLSQTIVALLIYAFFEIVILILKFKD